MSIFFPKIFKIEDPPRGPSLGNRRFGGNLGKQPESGCLQHENDMRVDPIGLHEARIGLLEAAIGLSVGPDTLRQADARS